MLVPWMVFFLEGFISFFFSTLISENNFLFSLLIIFINSIAVLWTISRKKYRNYLLLGYIFRLLLLVWDSVFSSIWQLPNSGFDTYTYHLSAMNGIQTGSFGRGGLYSQTIALVYRLFGFQMPIAQYANVLLSMTMIVLVLRIVEILKIDEKNQRFAIMLLCLLPNLAIMNSILLRETVVMFCITVSVWQFTNWYQKGTFINIIFSVVFGLLGALFHSGAIAIVLGIAIVFLLYDPKINSWNLSTTRIILSVVLVVAFFVINNANDGAFLNKFTRVSSADDIVDVSESYNAGGSAYDVGFHIENTYLNLIINTPLRMFYFLGSPMPWNWRGVNDIIAFVLDSVVFLYAIWFAVAEIKKSPRSQNRNTIIVFLIFALIAAAVFAWGVSNAGTALRHREKFITVFVLLLALCRQNKSIRFEPVRGKNQNKGTAKSEDEAC